MRIRRSLLSWLFAAGLLALPAKAQIPVTVTGTIQSPNGTLATGGYLQFDISPFSPGLAYRIAGTTVIAPMSARCGISSTGQLANLALNGPCLIWGNDEITPGNTTYNITYAPNNTITNVVRGVLIIPPSPYDLSRIIFSPLVTVVPQYQTIITQPIGVNLIPAANCVFDVGQDGLRYANGYFCSINVGDLKCRGGGTSCLPGGGGGGGAKDIEVNGILITGNIGNWNDLTPGPPSGVNVKWQKDNLSPVSNISASVPPCVSGGGHTAGVVPDPGATPNLSNFLRQDCTFAPVTVGVTNVAFTLPNDPTVGTTLSTLTDITPAGNAVIHAHASLNSIIGICIANCGTTGIATIGIEGAMSCVFDGAQTAAHYIISSGTTDGHCVDSVSYPTTANQQVLGRVLTTNAGGGTFSIDLFSPEDRVGGGGATGTCIGPTSPNYFCSGPAIPPGAVVGVVQFKRCFFTIPGGSTTPVSCPLSESFTAGDGLLTVLIGGASGGPICQPGPSGAAVLSDTLGATFKGWDFGTSGATCSDQNTPTPGAWTGSTPNWSEGLATNVPNSGAETVTVTWSAATGGTRPLWMYVFELTANVTQVDVFDGSTNVGSPSSATLPFNVATSAANETVLTFAENGVNASGDENTTITCTSTTITPYNKLEAFSGDSIGATFAGIGAASATGSYNYTCNFGATPFGFGMGIITLQGGATVLGPNKYKPLFPFQASIFAVTSLGHLGTTSCTTGINTYDTCTSVITISPAQTDTNYMPVCTGISPNDPRALIQTAAATSTTSITATVITEGSRAVNFGDIWCEAIHP